jgi:hypothetical protein
VIDWFVREMRRVLPPRGTMLGYAAVVAAIDLASLALAALFEWPLAGDGRSLSLPVLHLMAVCYLLAGHGIWRVTGFHPALVPGYRQWLRTTPWTPDRSLPRGPLHLTWQDAVVVAAATCLCLSFESWKLVPLAFLAGYLGVMTLANVYVGCDAAALGALFVLGPSFFAFEYPLLVGACGLAAYGICWAGYRQSLPDFPWAEGPRKQLWESVLNIGKSMDDGPWPRVHSSQLSDLVSPLPWWKPLAIAALVGWTGAWGTAAELWDAPLGEADRVAEGVAAFAFALAIYGGIGRLVIYLWQHRPPISLAGRLATGRLIIPRYDVAIVAPVVAVELGRRLPNVLIGWGMPLPGVAFASMFAVVAALFGLGPTLRWWHLVGEHRLVLKKPAPRRIRGGSADARR